MSEADAGPDRVEKDSPVREKMDPAAARLLREDRRSSSADTIVGDTIQLQSICYGGKTLKLPSNQPHMFQVVLKMLRSVYFPLVPQILVNLPQEWMRQDIPIDANQIAECAREYNRAAKPYAKIWGGSFNTETLHELGLPQCTFKIARDIVNLAYECAVPRPADLNSHYKSFSSEVYGETNLEQMASIIDELEVGPQDVFVDLGSGIGQLVCFTAAYARVKKAVGIEISTVPATIANDLQDYFGRLIKHFGKSVGKYSLEQGDFLNDRFLRLITSEATVIFINNFAFQADLMHSITEVLLQNCQQGVRIVTTKPFGNNKRSDRNINYRSTAVPDFSSISETVRLKTVESAVSWTSSNVEFYLTTLNHNKLITYFEGNISRQTEDSDSSSSGESSSKKKRTARESNGFRKNKTEAASSHAHAEPKWNEPDTEYTPPVKKTKKHKEESLRESSVAASSSSARKKKKEEKTPKAPKPPKSVRNSYSVEPSSTTTTPQLHHRPSQPRATAPPPSTPKPVVQQQEFKTEEPNEPDHELVHNPHIDEAVLNALNTIREFSSTSTPTKQAAIQDAINSVLKQTEQKRSQPVVLQAQQQPYGSAPPAPPPQLQAPVAVYPPAPMNPPPPPPPPTVIQPSAEIPTEQRHTFMIPPTDPLYDMVVSYYFGFKTFCNQAKNGDPDLILQLRNDIENEKAKKNELKESIESATAQINDLLASGVCVLKDRLEDLGMHGVADVSELLAGSKQIVTQHKTLTNSVAQMQSAVNAEEAKLAMIAGPDAIKYYEEAILQNNLDIPRLVELVLASRPANFVAQILPDDINGTAPEMKVSPSSRRPRQPRPRQGSAAGASGGGRRGGSSNGRRSDGANEDVELEIQQFVQHALKVDNAVKEKERKERLHRPARPIVSSTSTSTTPSSIRTPK